MPAYRGDPSSSPDRPRLLPNSFPAPSQGHPQPAGQPGSQLGSQPSKEWQTKTTLLHPAVPKPNNNYMYIVTTTPQHYRNWIAPDAQHTSAPMTR